MGDNGARGPLHDAELTRLPLAASAERHAALVVCDRAGRGLDVEDPVQRLEAAAAARPVLEALGLFEGMRGRLSPGERKINGAVAPHGTRPAAVRHRELGQGLCPACRRWAEVNEHRTGEPAPPQAPGAPRHDPRRPGAPEPAADGHGTYAAWRAHAAAGEELCGPCEVYVGWWSGLRRKRRGPA